ALASQAHAASSNQMDQAIFEEIDASFLGSAIPTPYTHEGAITGMASGPLVGGDILPDLFACGVKENPDAPEAPPPSDKSGICICALLCTPFSSLGMMLAGPHPSRSLSLIPLP
ncbi:unnamed protein product, partial [Chrysoparadoxa australica]